MCYSVASALNWNHFKVRKASEGPFESFNFFFQHWIIISSDDNNWWRNENWQGCTVKCVHALCNEIQNSSTINWMGWYFQAKRLRGWYFALFTVCDDIYIQCVLMFVVTSLTCKYQNRKHILRVCVCVCVYIYMSISNPMEGESPFILSDMLSQLENLCYLRLFSNEEFKKREYLLYFFIYQLLSEVYHLICRVTFFLPPRALSPVLFSSLSANTSIIQHFFFSLPLNISRHRNADMKTWTRGWTEQRAELLSAFIAEGNISAVFCIAIRFLIYLFLTSQNWHPFMLRH